MRRSERLGSTKSWTPQLPRALLWNQHRFVGRWTKCRLNQAVRTKYDTVYCKHAVYYATPLYHTTRSCLPHNALHSPSYLPLEEYWNTVPTLNAEACQPIYRSGGSISLPRAWPTSSTDNEVMVYRKGGHNHERNCRILRISLLHLCFVLRLRLPRGGGGAYLRNTTVAGSLVWISVKGMFTYNFDKENHKSHIMGHNFLLAMHIFARRS